MRKGALETLRLPFEEDPSLEIVAGKAMDFLSEDLSPTERAQRSGALRREPYGGVLSGAQLIRRTVFEKTGPFDASLRTGETVEWQIRARDAGVRQKQINVVAVERRIHTANKGLLVPTQQRKEYAIIRSRLARKLRRTNGRAFSKVQRTSRAEQHPVLPETTAASGAFRSQLRWRPETPPESTPQGTSAEGACRQAAASSSRRGSSGGPPEASPALRRKSTPAPPPERHGPLPP